MSFPHLNNYEAQVEAKAQTEAMDPPHSQAVTIFRLKLSLCYSLTARNAISGWIWVQFGPRHQRHLWTNSWTRYWMSIQKLTQCWWFSFNSSCSISSHNNVHALPLVWLVWYWPAANAIYGQMRQLTDEFAGICDKINLDTSHVQLMENQSNIHLIFCAQQWLMEWMNAVNEGARISMRKRYA